MFTRRRLGKGLGRVRDIATREAHSLLGSCDRNGLREVRF